MKDLLSAMHAISRAEEVTPVDSVLAPTRKVLHVLERGTWEDHLFSQVMQFLNERHQVLPRPSDKAEQARMASIIKHLSEEPR